MSLTAELVRATASDVPLVVSILDEAAAWLRRRGIAQWPERFDPTMVASSVEDGDTWIAVRSGDGVGTVTLTSADPLWPDDGKALYVHRLAVRRDEAGLGGWVLDQVRELARGQGRQLLRLDCVASNGGLRDYYESRGFQHRGEQEVHGAPGQRLAQGTKAVVSLYELPLSPTPNADQRTGS